MKRGILWLGLLGKRLAKKPGFLAIALLIPLLTGLYAAAASQDQGILTVALAARDPADPMAQEVISGLMDSSELINFRYMEVSRARQAVAAGKADCAWIFPENMEEKVDAFLKSSTRDRAFVTILQREESVPLLLAKEKLNARLYDCLGIRYYLQTLRKDAPELSHLTDGELLAYRDNVELPGELFVFSQEALDASQNVHYLLSPVRGLLAVVMLLGGLAAAMYGIRDGERGTFAWLPINRRPWAEFLQIFVALTLLGVGVLAALTVAGISRGLIELPAMGLYILMLGAFCYALRRVLGKVSRVAGVLPLLVTVSLVVCPVFFDLNSLTAFQYLLPPTYFICAPQDGTYLLLMLPYTALCLGISLLCHRRFQ